MTLPRRTAVLAAVTLGALPVLAACSSSADEGSPIGVQAAKDQCLVKPQVVKPGPVNVQVNWSGEGPGEVYVYGEENGSYTKVVGEIEDLTDGLTKTFTVDLAEGKYEVSCKLVSATDGIRVPIEAANRAS